MLTSIGSLSRRVNAPRSSGRRRTHNSSPARIIHTQATYTHARAHTPVDVIVSVDDAVAELVPELDPVREVVPVAVVLPVLELLDVADIDGSMELVDV